MQEEVYLKQMDDYVQVPDGYYLLPDDVDVQYGDKYFHYATERWQAVVGSHGHQKVIGYQSAVCRPRASFKNVVTIE